MRPALDLTDQTFGHWTVLYKVESRGTHSRWLCRCVCGVERVVDQGNLRQGLSRSCGCRAYADRKTRKEKNNG